MMRARSRGKRTGLRSSRGSTLPFVLVIISVLGITLAAGLPQSQTGLKVHKTFADLRDAELSDADGAIDGRIQAIRDDDGFGWASAWGGKAGECSNPSGWENIGTTPAPDNLIVYCKPDANSGKPTLNSAISPPNSILTLGGHAAKTSISSYQGPGTFRGNNDQSVPSYYYPSCADFHGYQSNGNADRCEAGLMIGRGLDPEGGGLIVASNGSTAGEPMVWSNSSIIASAEGGLRQLKVDGAVEARGYCGAGGGIEVGGLDQNQVIATPATAKRCVNGEHLKLDPTYTRVPLPPALNASAIAHVPSVAYPLDATTCEARDGFVEMPAKEIAPGWYAAWYKSATALSNFMSTCTDALFWFRPGVYYFDFLDSGPDKHVWDAPDGCIPTNAMCIANEIIGGTPRDWNPCKLPAEADVANCLQPERILGTQKNDTSAAWVDPEDTAVIDGDTGSVEIWKDNQTEWVSQRDVAPPIPQRGETQVQSVKIEVAYNLPHAPWYENNSPNGSKTVSGDYGALLDISTASGGHCFMHLPPGNKLDYVAGTQQTRASTSVDLTKGCPLDDPRFLKATGGFPISRVAVTTAEEGGVYSGPYAPSAFTSTPNAVNLLKATVTVKAKNTVLATSKKKMEIDGTQFVVQWKGRPAPPYPDGCDPTRDGVQFIFGNWSRMQWGNGNQKDAYVELCGLRADTFPNVWGDNYKTPWGNVNYKTAAGHDLGIAIYGLHEDSSPPPRALNTDPTIGNTPTVPNATTQRTLAPVRFYLGGNTETSSNPGWSMVNGTNPPTLLRDSTNSCNIGAVAYPGCEYGYLTIGDGARAYTQPWSSNNQANLSFQIDTSQIPAKATILNVQVRVAHREGLRSTTTQAYEPGLGIQGIDLNVSAGPGVPSNGQNGGNWSDGSFLVQTFPTGMTGCSNVDAAYVSKPSNTCLSPCLRSGEAYCLFEWGNRDAAYETWPGNAARKPWAWQRTLTDQLDTPEALANSIWSWRMRVPAAPAGKVHEIAIDGIEVEVEYRLPTDPRPLRGCLTTRLGWRPDELLRDPTPVTGDSWTWNRTQPGYVGPPGTGTGLPKGYGWYDRDWGPRNSISGWDYQGDQAFGDFTGTNPPGELVDLQDCPLLELVNNSGRVKFHVQGMIYAPSAALSMSGRDNDAQWTTQGIVARQLSAIRWRDGGDIPAVGDPPIRRDPRKVTLELRKPNGEKVRCVVAQIDDKLGDDTGLDVNILSWTNGPCV